MKNIQTIVLCLLVLLMSCNKDDSPSNGDQNQGPDPTAFAENFGSAIQRNFLGKVIDKNHNPIQDVTITIGSATAQTDANGIFIINNATVHQRFGYVKAEKAGYMHGSRSVVPSSGTNKVTIMLLEENVVGTTNSGTTETIALPNGASVALLGDYKKEDGTAYSGSVNVIMHHLDPANEDMQDQMPGMLYAANAQNEERMLQTFGMLAIELKGNEGETLNLADGSSAEIKMPLDASLLTNAPSTIPLWHFDETHGYWVEDGQATLVGNAYVGTVTHFSFWNCDIPAEAVILNVTMTDENGNPLSNMLITISSAVYGTRNGTTNPSGIASGLVPKNETLQILAFATNNNSCSDALYSGEIGPFATNSSIVIVSQNLGLYWITESITGNFNSCNGDDITEGYVELNHNFYTYFDAVTDGNFEFNFVRCSSSNNLFNLKAYDYTNIQETDNINFTFTSPMTNVGTIASCNNIEEFITYQIDNDTIWSHNFNINANFVPTGPNFPRPTLTIYTNNQNECFYLQGVLNDVPYIGSYDNYDYNIPNDTGFWIAECINMSENNNNVIYNLNTIGNVGEYIDINFSGDYEDTQGNPHTITGTIHVLRDQ